METIVSTPKKDISFRIRKEDINSNGEIFPHILLDLLEEAVLKPVVILEKDYEVLAKRSSYVYKVDIIGKAAPGEDIKVNTQLGKFDSHTAIFNIQVMKKDKRNRQVPICKASFSYKLENNLAIDKIAS